MTKKLSVLHRQNTAVTYLVTAVCVFVFIGSSYQVVRWIRDSFETQQTIRDVATAHAAPLFDDGEQADRKPGSVTNIDFPALLARNSDTVGWIEVSNTDVSYPIVQAKDNEYYLTHSFRKTENGAGWIYLDYRSSLNEPDRNTIIYGHNRRDGTMFTTLKKLLRNDWTPNDAPKITIATPDSQSAWQVFSAYTYEPEMYYLTTDFATTEDFKIFVETIKKRSSFNLDVPITNMDKVLTLSTCDDGAKQRIVVHAKLIQE